MKQKLIQLSFDTSLSVTDKISSQKGIEDVDINFQVIYQTDIYIILHPTTEGYTFFPKCEIHEYINQDICYPEP